MIIIPFKRSKHKKYYQKLIANRDLPDYSHDLPKFGLIALHNNEPIAIGFLRKMEGGYAMMGEYMTNPQSLPEVRDRALDLITYKLIKIAKSSGLKGIMAFTKEQNIIDRATKHGFVVTPDKFIAILL